MTITQHTPVDELRRMLRRTWLSVAASCILGTIAVWLGFHFIALGAQSASDTMVVYYIVAAIQFLGAFSAWELFNTTLHLRHSLRELIAAKLALEESLRRK